MTAPTETDEVTKVFFSYLKKSLHRSARNYISAENLMQIRTVYLEDFTPKELDTNFPCDSSEILRTKRNFHFHLQNELLAVGIPELDEDDREFLFVLFYDRMTVAEVAEVLGVTQQAIYKRRSKLLKRLKCCLM
jgi:RNA polymerase sigma factor (sigma-70 family)